VETILLAADVTAGIDAFTAWAITVAPALIGLVTGLAALRFGLKTARRVISGG